MLAAWDQPLVNPDHHGEGPLGPEGRVRPAGDGAASPGAAACAFEEWLEGLRPRVLQLAGRLLGSPHDAEEAVQDAFLLAWQRIGQVEDLRKRNAWLYRTTINQCMNRLRRKRARPLPPADALADHADFGRRSQTTELADRVRFAVNQLPEHQHAALVLREMEGLSYDEVATILERRPAAVRVLVHRAREAVRQILLRKWPDTFGPDR